MEQVCLKLEVAIDKALLTLSEVKEYNIMVNFSVVLAEVSS